MELRIGMFGLMPCSGVEQINVPKGHVYKALRIYGFKADGTPKSRFHGFVTLRKAYRRFGKDNIMISGSDTLCPDCYKYHIDVIDGNSSD